MGGRAFQRQGSLLKYEYLTFLFGIVIRLGFPCAEDLVDPAVNDKYLVISKLPVGAFKDSANISCIREFKNVHHR